MSILSINSVLEKKKKKRKKRRINPSAYCTPIATGLRRVCEVHDFQIKVTVF